MALTWQQMFVAMLIQESGDSYSIVNKDSGALGRYQVMPANLTARSGDWGTLYLKRRVSPQEFLNSPRIQDQIAMGRFKYYFDKYGARGAAAAWYSGRASLHNSTAPQYSNGRRYPSIKSYVDSVVNRAGGVPADGGPKMPGGGGGGGGSGRGGGTGRLTPGGGGTGRAPKKANPYDALRAEYGFSDAFYAAYPEIDKLVDRFIQQGTDMSMPEGRRAFDAAFRNTDFYKGHSEKERLQLIKKYGDPAQSKKELDDAYIKIRQMANQLGLIEYKGIETKYKSWAYNMATNGWSPEQLRYEMGKYVEFGKDGTTWQGEAGEVAEKLHSYAYDMGVRMSKSWYLDSARNVVRGVASVNDSMTSIRQQAMAAFPQWRQQLYGGKTVMELAQPYTNAMAGILELPPSAVTLFDPTIKKALQFKDPQTGLGGAKPLWQFENELRNDPRWAKTKNAQHTVTDMAYQVLKDFGLKT